MIRKLLLIAVFLAVPQLALAQQLPTELFNAPLEGSAAAWIVRTFGLLTVLSVAPGILVMVTSFPRFIIAFSILRSGMGLGSTPSSMILSSMALFMTFYVMSPTLERSWQEGVQPLLQDQLTEQQAVERIAEPFRTFMLANTRDKDLALVVVHFKQQRHHCFGQLAAEAALVGQVEVFDQLLRQGTAALAHPA